MKSLTKKYRDREKEKERERERERDKEREREIEKCTNGLQTTIVIPT